MQVVSYDKTFPGFLSAIFDIYEYKFDDVTFLKSDSFLFGQVHLVTTSETNATRVWKGIKKYSSTASANQLYHSFLSEEEGIEHTLYRFIKHLFASKGPVDQDFGHEAVLAVSSIAKKVHREKHRMEAFVRFKLTKDKIYYAFVEPDFNVLPLIINHFQRRYADQCWMIYDSKRRYGIHYDTKAVTTVTIDFNTTKSSGLEIVHDADESFYQELWKNYFKSVNISARKNMKLHIRHMPFRYWKFLTEKL